MTVKKFAGLAGALALVVVLGAFAFNTAFAQTGTPQATPQAPTAPAAGSNQGQGLWRGDDGLGFFGGSWTTFDAEAKALNLTPAQLFEQLHSGKTLSDIAQAQGVTVQSVQDAAKAVQVQATKDNIAQAVKNGTMTQAQADWLLQGIDKGYTNGLGPGFGLGFGGRGGPHSGFGPGAPSTAPTAPSGNSTQGSNG